MSTAGKFAASAASGSQGDTALWADQLEAGWLPTSFALVHARDLFTQIEYGPAIAAAITKVQLLLDADAASVCIMEPGGAVQHLVTAEQELISINSTAGSQTYPQLSQDTLLQRRETCATCRLLPHVAWCASAPLYAEGRQFGLLCAARGAQRPAFGPDQMHLLHVLALCSAIAISNARRMRTLQEQQRSQRERIATHLHDNTAQSLSIIGLKVDQVTAALGPTLSADAAEQLRTIKSISQQLMTQVRAAFGELRQAEPQPGDLVSAVGACIDIFTQTARLPVEFSVAGNCLLPGAVQAQAVLVVREALNNVARHAQARNVWVKLLSDSATLRIIIQDDGVGFDPRIVETGQRHLGTILMHERAERSGGAIRVESQLGCGTQVTLTYPATHPAAARP